jgi:hypothetical protein
MKFEKERPERDSLAASQVMGSGLGYMATCSVFLSFIVFEIETSETKPRNCHDVLS